MEKTNKTVFDRQSLVLAVHLVTIYLLSCFDYFITIQALTRGAIEVNPLLAPVILTPLGALLKLTLPVAVLGYLWLRRGTSVRVAKIARGLLLLYLGVVIWNLWVFNFML